MEKGRRRRDRDVHRCKLASRSKCDHRASVVLDRSCWKALPFPPNSLFVCLIIQLLGITTTTQSDYNVLSLSLSLSLSETQTHAMKMGSCSFACTQRVSSFGQRREREKRKGESEIIILIKPRTLIQVGAMGLSPYY